MTRVISFASQKGGVGKTTSAINVTTALALGGYRVLMIDLDPQGSVRPSFGVQKHIEKGTFELFCDQQVALEDLCTPTKQENMDFIFSNVRTISEEQRVLRAAKNYHLLQDRIENDLDDVYDFVIIDAPPGTGVMGINAMVAADLIVIPLQCEALAVKSLGRLLKNFKELKKQIGTDIRIAGILLTMYDHSLKSHQMVASQVNQVLKHSIFQSIIPRCDQISQASIYGKPVIHKNLSSIGATAYVRFTNEILDRFQLR